MQLKLSIIGIIPCYSVHVKSAISREIAIHNTTIAPWKIKMSSWLHHVIPQSCLTAGELKDCLEDELQRHSVILSLSFLRDFGQQSSPTHTSWLLSGGIASAIFFLMKSEEIHKQPEADHISFFFFLSLLLYSIILSDRPLLWALAPLLIPISERQRGPLVCRHASGNWIIPEIWASAQKGICN